MVLDQFRDHVSMFLKVLAPLLNMFRETFDPDKYLSSVDGLAGHRDDGAGADAEGANHKSQKFDPAALHKSIQDPFFNCYVTFALLTERVPEKKLALIS